MKHLKLIYMLALSVAPHIGLAQQPALNFAGEAVAGAAPSSNPVSSLAPKSAAKSALKPAGDKPLLGRWLDLETMTHSERYRNAFAVGGVHDFDNAQQRSLLAGKIKIDSQGRYDIGFRASSGRYFNWAYGGYTGTALVPRTSTAAFATTYLTPPELFALYQSELSDPAGLTFLKSSVNSNGWQFYMRELYFSATPVKPVTAEFGFFGFERGFSTEITTFDEDGYLSGERFRVHDPGHVFFDEVGFTNAFFGDIGTPNLFARGPSLKKANYRQAFAKKQLNTRIGFSGEYTWQADVDTLREAVLVATKESRVVDSVRLEAYERLNAAVFPGVAQSPIGPVPPASVKGAPGFALTLQKKLGRLSGDIGYASIDAHYSAYSVYRILALSCFPLNGDTYGQGNRPFAHASYTIVPGVSAFGFYTHEVGGERVLTLNQQGFNAGMTFDLKALVNQKKLVF